MVAMLLWSSADRYERGSSNGFSFLTVILVVPIYIFCGCSSMVEHQPSKLDTWVRFPSPASVTFVTSACDGNDDSSLRRGHPLAFTVKYVCDSSTVGSTPPCQGGGRGFESRLSLSRLSLCWVFFCAEAQNG